MGLENRDYYRNQSSGGNTGFMSEAPASSFILIATIVVFLLQIFSARSPKDFEEVLSQLPPDIAEVASDEALTEEERQYLVSTAPKISVVQEWLELDTDKIIQRGQVWRLVTTAFCHDRVNIFHILFNMLLFYWFAPTLESMYGSREFMIFYLVAAVVASIAYIGLQLFTGERYPAIGASGAVCAVLCVYTMYYPRHQMLLFFILPLEMRWILLIYLIYDLHPVLLALAGSEIHTGVGHAAHLGGLAFGYFYWRGQWQLEPIWNSITSVFSSQKSGQRKRHLKVFHPESARRPTAKSTNIDEQVDGILQKISEHGEASLTDAERQILENASRNYRSRPPE